MKALKSIFILLLFSIIITSCTDLEIEEELSPIESLDPSASGDDDEVDDGSKT
jgi:hypothetical protein